MKLSPKKLSGTVAAIPSKSAAHRLFIAAALSDAPSTWTLPTSSVDIDTTLACLKAFGVQVKREDNKVYIEPIKAIADAPTIDCMESGSTLRFLLPLSAALGKSAHFVGRGRLPERPIADFLEVIEGLGAKTNAHKLPLDITGPLTGKNCELPGHVSSQYLTGLLMAAPLMESGLDIHLTTPLQSRPYIDLTLDVLKRFGIDVEEDGTDFHVPAASRYTLPQGEHAIEGDWSNASFFLAAGAIGQSVTVTGLDLASSQGDKVIIDILEGFGAKVERGEKAITVSPAPLMAQEISVKEIPDALPILSVVAAMAQGTTVFTDIERLRLKESDRIATTTAMLEAMGIHCDSDAHTMRVTGGCLHGGATIDSANDHRIAMACAIAASVADAPIALTGSEAVNKSYPHFYNDFNALGGDARVI